MLVVKLNGAGASLGDGEATGLGLDVLDLVPSLLGDVLGHQRVGRLDGGELSRHDTVVNTVDVVVSVSALGKLTVSLMIVTLFKQPAPLLSQLCEKRKTERGK